MIPKKVKPPEAKPFRSERRNPTEGLAAGRPGQNQRRSIQANVSRRFPKAFAVKNHQRRLATAFRGDLYRSDFPNHLCGAEQFVASSCIALEREH
jgi:hypothetical protein